MSVLGYDNATYSGVDVLAADSKETRSYPKHGNQSAGLEGNKVLENSKLKIVITVLFILLIALLLGALCACIAFAIEIANLKSETASLQTPSSIQQLQNAPVILSRIENVENLMQQLILSTNMIQQQLTDLDKRINQLNTSIDFIISSLWSEQHPIIPVSSCAALPPFFPSDYYWVGASSGSAVRVYCDMTRSCGGVTGGWMRVAELDMTDDSQQCPSGLRQRDDQNPIMRTCVRNSSPAGCSSVTFASATVEYSKVCGKIRAFQFGSTDSFGGRQNPTINDNYVDGISLTRGSPREHIWTFAAALDESSTAYPAGNCPCTNTEQASSATSPPGFVGTDYFCDTGKEDHRSDTVRIHTEDPLWDGNGCGPQSTCCSFNNPPWFYKQLPHATTDDIEMRVCRNQAASNEDIAIEVVEIYIQ